MIDIILILVVLLAIIILHINNLRIAVIYLSVFSLFSSAIYIFIGAPDVAIAEAAIGVSLSTVLYLVAIKKYRSFRIYYNIQSQNGDGEDVRFNRERLKKYIDLFLVQREVELEIVNKEEKFDDIENSYDYDIIIFQHDGFIKIYGEKSNYLYEKLIEYLSDKGLEGVICEYFDSGE